MNYPHSKSRPPKNQQAISCIERTLARDGWHSWGNEVVSDLVLEAGAAW